MHKHRHCLYSDQSPPLPQSCMRIATRCAGSISSPICSPAEVDSCWGQRSEIPRCCLHATTNLLSSYSVRCDLSSKTPIHSAPSSAPRVCRSRNNYSSPICSHAKGVSPFNPTSISPSRKHQHHLSASTPSCCILPTHSPTRHASFIIQAYSWGYEDGYRDL